MMAGPPMTAMPQLRQYRPPQRPQNRPRAMMAPQVTSGPKVVVFVGNITDKAPDQMIRHILAACGTVVSWKRVQGRLNDTNLKTNYTVNSQLSTDNPPNGNNEEIHTRKYVSTSGPNELEFLDTVRLPLE